jgi:hypothetical protein
MSNIEVLREWRARDRVVKPGVYSIPSDLSRIEARCCVADGSGKMVTEAKKETEPFRDPESRKEPAPENKSRGAAPESKAEVAGRRGRGDRTEPDA